MVNFPNDGKLSTVAGVSTSDRPNIGVQKED